jgi:hypothetical protein
VILPGGLRLIFGSWARSLERVLQRVKPSRCLEGFTGSWAQGGSELASGDLDVLHDAGVVLIANELVDNLALAVEEDDGRQCRSAVLSREVGMVVRVDCDEDEVLPYCLLEIFSAENFSL